MPEKKSYAKSELTRKKILSAALELMRIQGYQGTTIRGICTKAGVSPASFYCYFESKSDLLQDFYKSSDEYFGTDLLHAMGGKSFLEKIRIYVKEYANLNLNTGIDTMRVLYNPENVWFSIDRPMQNTLFSVIETAKADHFLSQNVDSQILVHDIFIILRGVCYDWCVHDGNYNLEKCMLHQVECYLFGATLIL